MGAGGGVEVQTVCKRKKEGRSKAFFLAFFQGTRQSSYQIIIFEFEVSYLHTTLQKEVNMPSILMFRGMDLNQQLFFFYLVVRLDIDCKSTCLLYQIL